MKKYEKYKDSGIEWIGEIPEDWVASRLKHFCSKITDGSHHSPPTIEDGRLYISVKDVGDNIINFENCKHISDEEFNLLVRNGCQPEEGDILLTKDGTIGRAVIINKNNDFVILSSLGLIRPMKKILDSTFARFFLISGLNVDQMLSLIQGSALTRITITIIKNLFCTFPPLKEQAQIANYLDHKTKQIDELIADKQNLIELLKEERTATINQAVTKGLGSLSGVETPNVPMKDSGIEWLGEIPVGWEVKKLKYVANLRSGDNIISEQISGSGAYKVFGGNGVRGYFSNFNCNGNYILIGRQGALCGNIKYATNKFWASEHAIVSYLYNNYNWIWFGKLLESMNLNQYSQSAAQPGLAVNELMKLSIPVPSLTEQIKITNYIEKKQTEINQNITKTHQQITLLKEYKTALISEVVTGKVDVRDEVLE